MGVKVVFDRVIVGWRGNDNEVGRAVCLGAIEGGGEIERFLDKIAFDILVLNG